MEEKKPDVQRLLFDQLKNHATSNISLINMLSDLLNISTDAVYRRLRGEKRLDVDEIAKICNHFNISFDTLFSARPQNLQFNYISLDHNSQDVYKQYMKQLLASFSALSKAKEKEVFFTAIDIPMFHFLPFTELTLFKVYSWSNSIGSFTGKFTDFLKIIKDNELIAIYQQLDNAYREIPSVEIWTEGTFDAILRLIDYHFESGCFSTKDEALQLCFQLLEMVDKINKWSVRGYKDELTGKVPYKLYLSDIELENNFIIIKRDGSISCMIKLYTINSMTTTNAAFCHESLMWINNAMLKSTMISGASQKESFKFFNLLTQKVRYLIERIENSKPLSTSTYTPY